MDFQSIVLDISPTDNQESERDKVLINTESHHSLPTGLCFHRGDGDGRFFRTQIASYICSNEGLFGRIS